jgi:hypothetical protein
LLNSDLALPVCGSCSGEAEIKGVFMSISSIGSMSTLSQLLANQTVTGTSTGGVASDSTDISPFASMMAQLQQLQQNDPAKFKSVMADVASTLQTDAQNATGSQAVALSSLASKFKLAAQTGQMPDQQSSGQATGAHHHHHVRSYDSQSAGTAATSSTGSTSTLSAQTPVNLAEIIQTALQDADS